MTTTRTWRALLALLLEHGAEVSPRGRTTKEMLAVRTEWDMGAPVLACPVRKLGYRFMVAEASWILSGDNRVSSIAPHSRQISQFSDDGLTFFGAYGPPFVDQQGYVVRNLAGDPVSRQAVATLWRQKPGPTKDVPCTVALQWIMRDGWLHCLATMRSSDAWLGVPYDVFNFSAMSAHVLLSLRHVDRGLWRDVQLGRLFLTAGSQHLYKIDWEAAEACAHIDVELPVSPARLDLSEFERPDEFTAHLKRLIGGPVEHTKHRWLTELPINVKKES